MGCLWVAYTDQCEMAGQKPSSAVWIFCLGPFRSRRGDEADALNRNELRLLTSSATVQGRHVINNRTAFFGRLGRLLLLLDAQLGQQKRIVEGELAKAIVAAR